MCDPSAPRHEMYDSSYPTEMPVWTSFQQRDCPELLDPVNSTSNRHSVGHKMHPTPAIDPRYSTFEQSSNGLLGSSRLANTIPPMARGTFKIDDVYGVPFRESMHTMANSNPYKQGDRNSCTILVETDIVRESSDSSGISMELPRVETIISSSRRLKSLDFDASLPALPQRKSLNLNGPLPSIPNSHNTQMSPTETSPCHRSSVMSRGHRLSSRASASCADTKVVGTIPRNMSPDEDWMDLDMCTESHGLREPSLMTSCSTDIDMMLAGHASSEDLTSLDKSQCPPIRSVVAPNAVPPTLDSPASDLVSPSSQTSGLSSSFSYMSPTISPIDELLLSDTNFVFPAKGTREGQHIEMVEHLEDAANDWILPSPSPLESVMIDLKHKGSGSTKSDLGLLSQRQGLHRATFPASSAQWTSNSVDSHPLHDMYQFEELSPPSFSTQPHLPGINIFGLATSVHSSGIDKSVESDAPSSMESLVAQVATSIPSASNLAPPMTYMSLDSSYMNDSLETVRVETPVPTFTSAKNKSNDHAPPKLPLVGCSVSHSSFSLLDPAEGRRDASLRSRRQMNVAPLNLSRSNISSSGDEGGEANPRRRRSRTATRNFISSQVSRQDQSNNEYWSRVEISGTESDVASAHEGPPDLSSALGSPPFTNTAPHCFDHRSLLVVHATSMQRQVEELQKLIGVVNDDLMQRLESAPELRLHCQGQPSQALFKKAFLTLRELLCGRIPQTFEDIFGFIRVALAVAFLLYCQNKFYDLDAFYEDAVQWQHAFSDQEEKKLFLKAMDCWCYLPKRRSHPLHNSRRPTSFGGITSQESSYVRNQTELLHLMRNSKAFRAYIDFLGGKSILIKTYYSQSD